MTPDELYNILPNGTFYINLTFNKIRNYDPHQRFPKPKYALYELLSPWYELVLSGRIQTDGYEAIKNK